MKMYAIYHPDREVYVTHDLQAHPNVHAAVWIKNLGEAKKFLAELRLYGEKFDGFVVTPLRTKQSEVV